LPSSARTASEGRPSDNPQSAIRNPQSANPQSAPQSPKGNGHAAGNGHTQLRIDGNGPAPLSDQFARFQLDAPSCDNCGAITVRNGNCYLCHNCGNSMGCS
jgi:ribonucleoside-diphosphate reductase alpha chain